MITALALATCFELVGPKFHYLPKEICMSSVALHVEQGILYIDSDTAPESMAAEMIRKTEDLWSFKGSRAMFEKSSGICSYYSRGSLSLEGEADIMGGVNLEELKVTVNYEYTNDDCHNPLRSGTAIYKLK